MTRLMIKLAAIVVCLMGSVMGKLPYRWLLHYLMGSGRPIRLRPGGGRWYRLFREAVEEGGMWEKGGLFTPYTYELVHTIGTATTRAVPGQLLMADFYRFHQYCYRCGEDIAWCGCDNPTPRWWNVKVVGGECTLGPGSPITLGDRRHRAWWEWEWGDSVQLHVLLNLWAYEGPLSFRLYVKATLIIEDSIFLPLGHPFMTLARLEDPRGELGRRGGQE